METKKMSLANIQGKLSRVEMKQIMAGSDGGTAWLCSYGGEICDNLGNSCIWSTYGGSVGHWVCGHG